VEFSVEDVAFGARQLAGQDPKRLLPNLLAASQRHRPSSLRRNVEPFTRCPSVAPTQFIGQPGFRLFQQTVLDSADASCPDLLSG
jgi:hypothetical protein